MIAIERPGTLASAIMTGACFSRSAVRVFQAGTSCNSVGRGLSCARATSERRKEPRMARLPSMRNPLRRIGFAMTLQVFSDPRQHLAVEKAAVFAFADPMIFVFPYDQFAGHAHPLQHAPVFERLVHRDAEIFFAYAQQDRSVKISGE